MLVSWGGRLCNKLGGLLVIFWQEEKEEEEDK